MNKVVAFLLSILSFSAIAQEHHFVMSLDTIGKYVNIQLTLPEKSNATLLKMPVWAPGYYMILDYPRYVVDFAPSSQDGKALEWKKEGKNGWLIDTRGVYTPSYRQSYQASAETFEGNRTESLTLPICQMRLLL